MFEVNVHGEALPTFREVKVDGPSGPDRWFVPNEVPIAFVYNRRNYAVMMGTPADLIKFAVGFSLTEGVVNSVAEIGSLDIHLSNKGVDLRFKISPESLERLDVIQRRRNLVGQASCGLCGLENSDTLFRTLPKVSEEKTILEPLAINRAFEELHLFQLLNNKTKTVHAAGWAGLDGEVLFVCEDVGRHNALDKLLGKMAMDQMEISAGFVIMSSRCSYEIIEKAARRGVTAIIAMSGPTELAIKKSREANLNLYFRERNQFVVLE